MTPLELCQMEGCLGIDHAKMNTDAHSRSHTQVVPLSIKASAPVDWTCFARRLVLLCTALFSFKQLCCVITIVLHLHFVSYSCACMR